MLRFRKSKINLHFRSACTIFVTYLNTFNLKNIKDYVEKILRLAIEGHGMDSR